MTDQGIGYISKAIGSLPMLTAITLSFYEYLKAYKLFNFSNTLTNSSANSITEGISGLAHLNTLALNLNGSGIDDEGIKTLSEAIKKSTKLNSLAMILSG